MSAFGHAPLPPPRRRGRALWKPPETTYLDGINDPGDDYRKYDVTYEVGSLRYSPRNDSGASCRESALLKKMMVEIGWNI